VKHGKIGALHGSLRIKWIEEIEGERKSPETREKLRIP